MKALSSILSGLVLACATIAGETHAEAISNEALARTVAGTTEHSDIVMVGTVEKIVWPGSYGRIVQTSTNTWKMVMGKPYHDFSNGSWYDLYSVKADEFIASVWDERETARHVRQQGAGTNIVNIAIRLNSAVRLEPGARYILWLRESIYLPTDEALRVQTTNHLYQLLWVEMLSPSNTLADSESSADRCSKSDVVMRMARSAARALRADVSREEHVNKMRQSEDAVEMSVAEALGTASVVRISNPIAAAVMLDAERYKLFTPEYYNLSSMTRLRTFKVTNTKAVDLMPDKKEELK